MEAKPFRKACPEAEVLICGVGMAAAAATMSSIALDVKARNEEILLAGIAGCYDASKSPIGEVVEVVSEIIGELPERFAVRYKVEPRWSFSLSKVSSNTVSKSNTPHSESQIENMEGAVIFSICRAHRIRVSQIRAISNHVADPLTEWRIEEAIGALTQTLTAIYNS